MYFRPIVAIAAALLISLGGAASATAAVQQGGGNADAEADAAPQPPPRDAEGRILLGGGSPDETGVWDPTIGIRTPLYPIDGDLDDSIELIPFKPWARALYADRQEHELEPHARCKPSSVSRPFLTPYGTEIVHFPDLKRIYIFDIGGPHSFRTIYMDGRTHPPDLSPTYLGHSIGWWEGDTLVIDTVGFNEGTWMDRRGAPYSDQLHTLERITRTSYDTLEYRVTIEDPETYTEPWTGGFDLEWSDGVELFEYICQQGNQAVDLMLGSYESVDRTAPIVP